MSAIESRAYSFVVKIWQERREVEGGEPLWRGRVDYVQGGERVYFHCLEQLIYWSEMKRVQTILVKIGPLLVKCDQKQEKAHEPSDYHLVFVH
jgi:hypothetical protein